MSKRSRSISKSLSKPSSPSSSPDRTKIHLPHTPSHTSPVMHCSLPPHRDTLSFASYGAYEVHYFQAHVNRCVECGRNFPTGHSLGLHIEENHDPLIGGRRERGERTSYDFSIVNNGIDKQTSMLRSPRRRISATPSPEEGRLRRRVSTGAPVRETVSQQDQGAMEVDELAKSMSALRFVPPSVAKARGFAGRKP